ncbi:hypothetical protein EMIT074MI3_12280 [Bacillus licheniformis]|nr:hypothetical protein MUY_001293 [Bacillus licheniformis WX-02]BCE06033.1 hypothetical protein RSC1_02190 [Bacillus paralicheniformis]BCE12260.1 hypothetical protein RSC2_04056 [Bacillus paralicheniformis]BCE13885.1 hypothetical protein RSC3_01241 [Bacillus paralicheniformis]
MKINIAINYSINYNEFVHLGVTGFLHNKYSEKTKQRKKYGKWAYYFFMINLNVQE